MSAGVRLMNPKNTSEITVVIPSWMGWGSVSPRRLCRRLCRLLIHVSEIGVNARVTNL